MFTYSRTDKADSISKYCMMMEVHADVEQQQKQDRGSRHNPESPLSIRSITSRRSYEMRSKTTKNRKGGSKHRSVSIEDRLCTRVSNDAQESQSKTESRDVKRNPKSSLSDMEGSLQSVNEIDRGRETECGIAAHLSSGTAQRPSGVKKPSSEKRFVKTRKVSHQNSKADIGSRSSKLSWLSTKSNIPQHGFGGDGLTFEN